MLTIDDSYHFLPTLTDRSHYKTRALNDSYSPSFKLIFQSAVSTIQTRHRRSSQKRLNSLSTGINFKRQQKRFKPKTSQHTKLIIPSQDLLSRVFKLPNLNQSINSSFSKTIDSRQPQSQHILSPRKSIRLRKSSLQKPLKSKIPSSSIQKNSKNSNNFIIAPWSDENQF